ncbi:hypothetical protein HDU93_006377 [Gonapodya sp. JEL0774]|nr:hypothetical protein HDU93_006377 [Gonapodya sp. JEL0774]
MQHPDKTSELEQPLASGQPASDGGSKGIPNQNAASPTSYISAILESQRRFGHAGAEPLPLQSAGTTSTATIAQVLTLPSEATETRGVNVILVEDSSNTVVQDLAFLDHCHVGLSPMSFAKEPEPGRQQRPSNIRTLECDMPQRPNASGSTPNATCYLAEGTITDPAESSMETLGGDLPETAKTSLTSIVPLKDPSSDSKAKIQRRVWWLEEDDGEQQEGVEVLADRTTFVTGYSDQRAAFRCCRQGMTEHREHIANPSDERSTPVSIPKKSASKRIKDLLRSLSQATQSLFFRSTQGGREPRQL